MSKVFTKIGNDLKFSIIPHIEHYWEESGGIWGEIENTGTSPYKDIDIEVTCYDKNSKKISGNIVNYITLKPGQAFGICVELHARELWRVGFVEMKIINEIKR